MSFWDTPYWNRFPCVCWLTEVTPVFCGARETTRARKAYIGWRESLPEGTARDPGGRETRVWSARLWVDPCRGNTPPCCLRPTNKDIVDMYQYVFVKTWRTCYHFPKIYKSFFFPFFFPPRPIYIYQYLLWENDVSICISDVLVFRY